MMNLTRSLNKNQYMQSFLFDRYKTIENEQKPESMWDVVIGDVTVSLKDVIGPNLLSDTVYEMCKIIRVEPENPYSLHRAIPSARNLFSNLLQAYVPNDDGTDIYQYDYIAGDFIYIGTRDKVITEAVTLVILYQHQNIGRMYGRFGFLLSLLDAGHEIHHLEEVLNIKAEVEYFPNQLRLLDENTIASIMIHHPMFNTYNVNAQKKIQKVPYSYTRAKDNTTNLDKHTQIYDDFCKEINEDQIRIHRIMRKEDHDYEVACQKRTSFQSFQGLMFTDRYKEMPPERRFSNTRYLKGLETVVIDCCNKKIYGSNKDNFNEIDIEKILNDSHEYVNMSEIQLLILTVVKKGEYSPKEIATSFVQSGEWMNKISAYYANYNMITRCLRNINDYYVKDNVVECEYVTYLLMVGNNQMDYFLKGVV